MTPEKLHALVHSLTRDEKSFFTRTGFSGKKKLDQILYERILAEKLWSKKGADRIRKGSFQDSTKYYLYRLKLAEKIIGSLAQREDAKYPVIPFLKWAIHYDAREIAEQFLAQELNRSFKAEDFELLAYLLAATHKLESRYRVTFQLPEGCPSLEEAREILDTESRWQSVLSDLRRLMKGESFRTEHFSVKTLRQRMQNLATPTRFAQRSALKTQVGLSLLESNPGGALELQRDLITHMDAYPDGLATEHLRELAYLTNLSVLNRDQDAARAAVVAMRCISASTPFEKRLQSEMEMTTTVTVGEQFAQAELVHQGIALLRQNGDSLAPTYRNVLLLASAVSHAYLGEYAETLKIIFEIQNDVRKHWEAYKWEINFLAAFCYWKTNEHEMFDSFLAKSQRAGRALDTEYPRLANSILYQFGQEKHREQLDKFLQKLDLLFVKGPEKDAARLLDLRIFLMAEQQGILPCELIGSQGKNALLAVS